MQLSRPSLEILVRSWCPGAVERVEESKPGNRGELAVRPGSGRMVCYLWRWSYTWDWTREDSLLRLLGNGCGLLVQLLFEDETEQLGRSERVVELLWLHH